MHPLEFNNLVFCALYVLADNVVLDLEALSQAVCLLAIEVYGLLRLLQLILQVSNFMPLSIQLFGVSGSWYLELAAAQWVVYCLPGRDRIIHGTF